MNSMNQEQQVEVARDIIRMLDQFGLDAEQQIRCLGFPEGTRTRTLRKHRDDTPFPDDPVIQERVRILAHISDALRTTYPTNPQMGLFWIRRKNRRLNDATPAEILGRGSRDDLYWVLQQLDCTVHWDMTGSKG